MSSIHKRKKKHEHVPLTEEALERQRQKNQEAIRLLREWMADESGYDERVGPILEKALKENRLVLRGSADD